VLNLLQDLQAEFNLTYLFISHDLSVVRYISDRVGILYLGELVETGPTAAVFRAPRHPYTASLLSAVPRPVPGRAATRVTLKGEISSPLDLPRGCVFHPRCPVAEARCAVEKPMLSAAGTDRAAACHFPERAASLAPAPA
ncbi:MAG: oligopeptide/dipeptide ABC transporter ATP-binding protein, partial [Alphaproteobacteria bacterium]